MAITSQQLKSADDVARFWSDPFGHRKFDYTKRAATDLSDFVAHCFHLVAWVVSRHAEKLGDGARIDTSDSIYRLRDQFVETIHTYATGFVGPDGELDGNEPVIITDPADIDNWLSLTWRISSVVGNEINFVLATDGIEKNEYKARLDHITLNPKSKGTGPSSPDQLKHFGYLNNVCYAVIKLWRVANWCRGVGLKDVSRIMRCTIDAVGDQEGNVELLAKQAELFREIQDGARGSALSRILAESR